MAVYRKKGLLYKKTYINRYILDRKRYLSLLLYINKLEKQVEIMAIFLIIAIILAIVSIILNIFL